jgi:hypothetical protein
MHINQRNCRFLIARRFRQGREMMMPAIMQMSRLCLTLPLVLAMAGQPALGQTKPERRPAPEPAHRPTTLPSYPDRPGLERPRPSRPVTLPSYPSRPVNRPGVRPPYPPVLPSRPGVHWGYQYPSSSGGFARTLRCESRNNRFVTCPAITRGRVVLERRHNGRCRFNEGWGYDARRIWVARNCRATFAYGVGGYYPRYQSDRNDTALVIGGVAVAAGLVALLSSSGSASDKNGSAFPAQVRAQIDADPEAVRPSARPAYRQCLERAASNIAATGGNRLSVADVTIDSLNNGEYRFDVDVKANYPDKARKLAFSCTATADKVEDFDFITDN